MLGIYFSGTGNSKHCVETFVELCSPTNRSISIENPNVLEEISEHDTLVLGYPVYFSNTPKILWDFLIKNGEHFRGKKVFIIATMGLFSGDGAGCAARLLRKHQASILGGLHLKMPDCIGDEKALKRGVKENREIITQAENKIAASVSALKLGNPTKEGLNIFYHIAGLLGQRLWFYRKTISYKSKPVVDARKCIGCGRCAELCPMHNIEIINNKAVSHNKCTLCYRCFSHCPAKALTILGKKVYEQCLFENYKQPAKSLIDD